MESILYSKHIESRMEPNVVLKAGHDLKDS